MSRSSRSARRRWTTTDVASSRSQLDRALAATPQVKPDPVAIFGGVVDPAKLRFPFNRLPASDARDWDAIAGVGRRGRGPGAGAGAAYDSAVARPELTKRLEPTTATAPR